MFTTKQKGKFRPSRPRKRGKRSVAKRKRDKKKKEDKTQIGIKEGLIPAPAKKPRIEEDEATSQEVAATSQGAASTSQGAASTSQGAASTSQEAVFTSQEATATSQEVTIKVEPTVDVENEAVDAEQPDAQPSIDIGQSSRKKKSSKFTPGPYFIKGRRIVDAGYFITELLNLNAHNQSGRCSLADMSTSMECTKGIVSGFVFKCKVCRFRTVIWTEDPESCSDMNADVMLATMDLVDDLQSMNRYFARMKLPRFNRHFFKWKYNRLTKEPVVDGEEAGDGEELCGEEDMDMQCEDEKAEVLIDDSIVIKEEPADVFSDAENEELTGSTQMGGISSSQTGVAIEMDKNVVAVGGSSSATTQRDKQSIETFTIDAGSERSCSKTDQLVTIPKNSEAGANVRDNSSVSIIESNLHKTTLDSTFGSYTEGTKQPYVAGCVTLAESNLSKRVYAYSVEFLVSLSKFVWSSLFVCVDCLKDFATHDLIKAHSCKTYSKSILGVPPPTDFQRNLPTEKTRACFETLKSSMAEKKTFLDLAVSSSKEVQRMMNNHAQHRRATEEKMAKYEQAVAKEKAQKSKNPDVSNAVTAAFSEVQDSLASEETAENLLKAAKRNQVHLLEAAAEATERECLALVDFVKSLREDQVDSPQKTSENRQEHPGTSAGRSRKYRSPNKNFRFDELEYRFGSPRRTSENQPDHPSITYKEKPRKPKKNLLLDEELQSKVAQLVNKNVFILPKSSGNQS